MSFDDFSRLSALYNDPKGLHPGYRSYHVDVLLVNRTNPDMRYPPVYEINDEHHFRILGNALAIDESNKEVELFSEERVFYKDLITISGYAHGTEREKILAALEILYQGKNVHEKLKDYPGTLPASQSNVPLHIKALKEGTRDFSIYLKHANFKSSRTLNKDNALLVHLQV